MMKKSKILSLAVVVMALGMSAPVQAKECKDELVEAKGKYKLTRIMAYPSSLFAWRKTVDGIHGPAYHSWRRASQRNVDCAKVPNEVGKMRWQCTRTALPCAKNGKGDGTSGTINDGGYNDNPQYPGETLYKGRSGRDVRALQVMLKEAGYNVTIDGDFGNGTRNAVKAFQKTEAIQVDGVVGRETWDRLAG